MQVCDPNWLFWIQFRDAYLCRMPMQLTMSLDGIYAPWKQLTWKTHSGWTGKVSVVQLNSSRLGLHTVSPCPSKHCFYRIILNIIIFNYAFSLMLHTLQIGGAAQNEKSSTAEGHTPKSLKKFHHDMPVEFYISEVRSVRIICIGIWVHI